MKKSLFSTVFFLWGASFLSLQAQDCAAPPAPNVNWSGCDKSGLDLFAQDLTGANLSGTNLSNASFVNVGLVGANLTGANVTGANFSDVNLGSANLSNADLTGASLQYTSLMNTILFGANLTGADLNGANFYNTTLDYSNLSNADLTNASLQYLHLYGANLSGATLTGAIVTNAEMMGANLSGANLSGIGIYGNHASFSNSDLTNVNLTGANLSNMDLSNINISGADLTGANLTGVISGGITGTPLALPVGWQLINGHLVLTVATDSPMGGIIAQYSSNANYPNCYAFNGTTIGATDSPESVFAGPDIWYRFTAQSTAATISMTSSTMDDAVALYSRDNAGNYVLVGSSNASSGASDYERLIVSGLTPGTMYYASCGSTDGAFGAFQVCIQHLMPSGCASAAPEGGFSLCDAYRATYRGAPSQGVTYDFTFSDQGYNTTNTVSGTNGYITLSNPALGLRWGSLNNAKVDVNYHLLNSAGVATDVTIAGSTTSARCGGIFMRNFPLLEVKTAQRCPTTLYRGSYLAGQRVAGEPLACGANGYVFEFTQVTSCTNPTVVGLPFTVNTPNNSPYIQLGVLPSLGAQGAWKVRIAPKFSTLNGINYTGDFGPAQYIVVNGTSASNMLGEGSAFETAERSLEVVSGVGMYPNPNNGELLNLNITDVKSESAYVRILDATGRMVYSNRFTADGSLNTIITFPAPLSHGMYMVECTVDGEVKTERLVVE